MEHLVTNAGPLQSPASAWPPLNPNHPTNYSVLLVKQDAIQQLLHDLALDMRWQIVNEMSIAELAITISYPTRTSGIIVS